VVALAEVLVLGEPGHDHDESLPMMLLFSIELVAVVAFGRDLGLAVRSCR
jgi:hypothetical protein